MHEASIIAGLIKILEEEAAKHNITHIETVHVQAGLLTAIEPQTLCACFDIYKEGTAAENASLQLEMLPIQGTCRTCHKPFNLKRRAFTCPLCGSLEMDIHGGRELLITSIEVSAAQ